jgi:hypothetical protein
VDVGDFVGMCEAKNVGEADEVFVMVAEPLAANLLLAQVVALEHRAHRPVQDQDSLCQQPLQAVVRLRAGRL